MSFPLLVEAAETLFVPVAVYNNVSGPDAVILKKFKEPAWNNPVIRFLDATEADVIPRAEGYTLPFVVNRLVNALEKAKKTVPAYLQNLNRELSPKQPASAVFAMYCYWEGEAQLGQLDGVWATRIGELHGHEVVEVFYDAATIPFKKLVERAAEMKCTTKVYCRTKDQLEIATALVGDRAALTNQVVDDRTQQQYTLAHYPMYHFLPLTPMQATKINAALANKKSPEEFLSPRQIVIAKKLASINEAMSKSVKKLKVDRTWNGLGNYSKMLESVLEAK